MWHFCFLSRVSISYKDLHAWQKKLRRNGFALIVLVDLKKKIVFLSSKVNFKLEMAHA